MFRELVSRGVPMLYSPAMRVAHHVEPWRIRRRYFLKLHFVAGRKHGQFQTGEFARTWFGVPPFMIAAAAKQWAHAVRMLVQQRQGVLRQAMNGAHALGMVWGRVLRSFDTLRVSR